MINDEYMIGRLAASLEIPATAAEALWKATINCLSEELLKGVDIEVNNFGAFQVKTFPGRKTLFFTPGQHISIKKPT